MGLNYSIYVSMAVEQKPELNPQLNIRCSLAGMSLQMRAGLCCAAGRLWENDLHRASKEPSSRFTITGEIILA